MGKRRRARAPPPAAAAAAASEDDALPAASRSDHALPISPAPDAMPCSSGMELSLKENSSHSVDSNDTKPPSPVMDIGDSKVSNDHNSIAHHRYGPGRSIFLKRSHHYFGHQYSRRNSAHHGNASTSHGKFVPVRDDKLSFKLARQCNSESGRQAEKPNVRTERIRASSLVMDTGVSGEMAKMVCGICQKLLKRRPLNLGSALSSGELSVVAVLVCGHSYHADCLEQRTSVEDRRDPTCPICTGVISKDGSSKGQKHWRAAGYLFLAGVLVSVLGAF